MRVETVERLGIDSANPSLEKVLDRARQLCALENMPDVNVSLLQNGDCPHRQAFCMVTV
jgi:hypothetical protein